MVRRALLSLVALTAALSMPAEAQQPVCPLASLVPPRMEGVQQRVVVGQPQPCPPGGAREDYTVTTDFGDGTVASTPFDPADELYFIGGLHTYRRAGRYEVLGTVTDRRTGESKDYRRVIDVPNAPLVPRRTARPRFRAGREARRIVARYRDGNRLAVANDHRATVRWGDGSSSTGRVIRSADRSYAVVAAHRYGSGGAREIVTTVRDDRGATLRVRVAPAIRR